MFLDPSLTSVVLTEETAFTHCKPSYDACLPTLSEPSRSGIARRAVRRSEKGLEAPLQTADGAAKAPSRDRLHIIHMEGPYTTYVCERTNPSFFLYPSISFLRKINWLPIRNRTKKRRVTIRPEFDINFYLQQISVLLTERILIINVLYITQPCWPSCNLKNK